MTGTTLWLEITIAGSLYVTAGIFLVLSLFGIKDLSSIGIPADAMPYASVAFVVMSFLTGIVTLRLGQMLLPAISRRSHSGESLSSLPPDSNKDAVRDSYDYAGLVMVWQNGSERLHLELDRQYSLLALFGSLMGSVPLLGSSMFIWLLLSKQSFAWLPLALSALSTIGIWLAYRRQRSGYITLRNTAIATVHCRSDSGDNASGRVPATASES